VEKLYVVLAFASKNESNLFMKHRDMELVLGKKLIETDIDKMDINDLRSCFSWAGAFLLYEVDESAAIPIEIEKKDIDYVI